MTSPSIHTLFSIVAELGLSLDELLAAAISGPPAKNMVKMGPWPGRIVRREDRRSVTLPGGVRWEMLSPAAHPGIEFVEYVYEAGGRDGDDFVRRNGREYGLVLEGRLSGAVGFVEFELDPGDSIAFDSSAPHRFWNDGGVPARAVWVWRGESYSGDTEPQFPGDTEASEGGA